MKPLSIIAALGAGGFVVWLLTRPTTTATAGATQSNLLQQFAASVGTAITNLQKQMQALSDALKKQQSGGAKPASALGGAPAGSQPTAKPSAAKTSTTLPGGGPYSPQYVDLMTALFAGQTLAQAAESANVPFLSAVEMATGVNPGTPELVSSDIGAWTIDELPWITQEAAAMPNLTDFGSFNLGNDAQPPSFDWPQVGGDIFGDFSNFGGGGGGGGSEYGVASEPSFGEPEYDYVF